jgi:hypothetical protein
MAPAGKQSAMSWRNGYSKANQPIPSIRGLIVTPAAKMGTEPYSVQQFHSYSAPQLFIIQTKVILFLNILVDENKGVRPKYCLLKKYYLYIQ